MQTERKFIICFIILFRLGFSQHHNPLKIVVDMIDSVKNVKTLRVKITALERVNKNYLTASSEIKLNVSPRKLYFINRSKKLEILYLEGINNNKAFVRPHFPNITFSLDPIGNTMRKNQHYTIHELGFGFIANTIALAFSKEKDISKNVSYHGKHEKNGYLCHLIVYECKAFTFSDYIVQKKETVSGIAAKLNVNDFLLRSKNDLFNDFGYIKSGTKIQVPDYYCKKAVLYIDEKSLLPVSVIIYDDEGLFESYDYSNIIYNKPVAPEEFTKNYKEYRF